MAITGTVSRCGGRRPDRTPLTTPMPCRQQPDQRGQDRAVGPVEPGPRIGAAQHGDLVPEHEQLGVLGGCRPAERDRPAAGPPTKTICHRIVTVRS
jgi:hypothetical protein